MTWASQQRLARASDKLILFAYAYMSNPESGFAYPSVKWLSDFSSLNRKTVISCVGRLEKDGHLIDTGRRVGSTKQIKVYTVNVGEIQTIPKTGPLPKTVPEKGPLNSPVFSVKQSLKRDTEPVGKLKEESLTNVSLLRDSEFFDAFWTIYPVKKSKKAAKAAYLKALKDTDHGTLVAAVAAQRRWREWSDPRFIPHAATWLNRAAWSDEPSGDAGVAGRENTGSSRRGDTSFADIAARRKREREAGMEIPGGRTGVHGGHDGWGDGAIEGEYSAGGGHAGSRNGPADRG